MMPDGRGRRESNHATLLGAGGRAIMTQTESYSVFESVEDNAA